MQNFDFCATVEPTRTWPYMLWINPQEQRLRVRGAQDDDWIVIGGSGGGGAPSDAPYLVLALDPDLSAERRLIAGDGLQATDAGPNGDYTLNIDVSDFAGTGLEDDGAENLRIAAAAAGDGLQGGGGDALAVDTTVVRTSGDQTIAGVKTFQNDVVLDDGVGDSPKIQLVCGNDGAFQIWVEEGAGASENDLIIKSPGGPYNYANVVIRNASDDDVFRVTPYGSCYAQSFHASGSIFVDVSVNLRGIATLVLDADYDSSIYASADDVITVEAAGADQIHITDGKVYPDQDDDIDLGDATHEFKNAYFDGTVYMDAISMINLINEFSTDGTLAGNSNSAVPTERAVKTYVDAHAGGTSEGAEVHRSTDISYTGGAVTYVSFNVEDRDDAGFWAAGNPTRFTIPAGKAGWYAVNFVASFVPSTNQDYCQTIIRANGTTLIGVQFANRDSTAAINVTHTVVYYFSAGDYVEFAVNSDVSGTWTADAKRSLYARISKL